MKKILTFLAALSFLSTSTLSVVACGVGDGSKIDIIINAPKKAKDGQDPLDPSLYLYNDDYMFDNTQVNLTIGQGAQIAVFKIRDDKGSTLNSPTWKDFYTSSQWIDGSFSSFGLDTTNKPAKEHDFAFSAKSNQPLYHDKIKDNDASLDNNRTRVYWFITSTTPWSNTTPLNFTPTKDNIEVPALNEFNDKTKQITKSGWIHLYLLIANFRIDFSAEITFTFEKITDKNGLSIVTLDPDTWNKPFGTIKGDDPSKAYDKIANLAITTT